MKADDKLIELIREYISCSNYSCSILKQLYDSNEPLLRAKVLKLIPKEGRVEGLHYYFHGRGCLFEYENDSIDIDFGPDGRCDGFDEYRLKRFLGYRKGRFIELIDEVIFAKCFDNLIKAKIIRKHPLEPNDYLYYLSEKL